MNCAVNCHQTKQNIVSKECHHSRVQMPQQELLITCPSVRLCTVNQTCKKQLKKHTYTHTTNKQKKEREFFLLFFISKTKGKERKINNLKFGVEIVKKNMKCIFLGNLFGQMLCLLFNIVSFTLTPPMKPTQVPSRQKNKTKEKKQL